MGITHRMMFAQVSVTTVLVCALNVHQGASAPQYQYTYQGAGSSGYTYDISNPKPFNYKYNGNDLNYNFEYNANNNNNRNNLNYNYQYDGSNNNNLPSFNYQFTRLFALSPNCQANTRVTRQADESSFDVCSGDTSEFTKNVFLGVGELMTVLKEISIEFNEEVSPRDVALIDNTAAVINDGVDILSDLELAPLARAVTFSKECPASLADVSRSLNQIADVVDVVGGNNFQRRAY